MVDFPQKVAAAKEEKIGFIYHASDNTDGDIELIRLLTDQGIKDLSIKVARDEAVRFDTREVRWTVGDKPDSKAVTLTIAAGTVTPQKVRVSGGHQASLESVDATTWRVKIVPSSTAKSGQFTVVVEFDQPLPGKAAVILGVIQPKE